MRAAVLDKLKGARQLPLLALVLLLGVAALLYLNANPTTAQPRGGTALEARMAQVLGKVEGAGKVHVLLRETVAASTTDGAQLADGAVIVAEGAGEIKVQLALQRAAKALLGVPLERIEVLKMGDGK